MKVVIKLGKKFLVEKIFNKFKVGDKIIVISKTRYGYSLTKELTPYKK